MGNFISNQNQRYCDAGVILNIELTKNVTKDSIWISDNGYCRLIRLSAGSIPSSIFTRSARRTIFIKHPLIPTFC